ncbi:hypothetical protein JW859_05310 [bacterium]|nr:hypothetical protein [bacterium]
MSFALILKKVLRLLLALVVFLATGCPYGKIVGMYGIQPAYGIEPPPHDPSVSVTNFDYEPAVLQVGETINFTAITSRALLDYEGYVVAEIGDPEAGSVWATPHGGVRVYMRDDGSDGDGVAQDGVWYGHYTCPTISTPYYNLPVTAHIQWTDGYASEDFTGNSLSILPAVE